MDQEERIAALEAEVKQLRTELRVLAPGGCKHGTASPNFCFRCQDEAKKIKAHDRSHGDVQHRLDTYNEVLHQIVDVISRQLRQPIGEGDL